MIFPTGVRINIMLKNIRMLSFTTIRTRVRFRRFFFITFSITLIVISLIFRLAPLCGRGEGGITTLKKKKKLDRLFSNCINYILKLFIILFMLPTYNILNQSLLGETYWNWNLSARVGKNVPVGRAENRPRWSRRAAPAVALYFKRRSVQRLFNNNPERPSAQYWNRNLPPKQ